MTLNAQPAKLLRIIQVLPSYGTQRARFYSDVANGLVTKPVKPTHRVALWPEHEIAAINAARIAGRSPDELRALVRQLHEKRQADSPRLLGEE